MPANKTSNKGIGTKILKWIGIITAVISLVLGVREIVSMIRENTEQRERAAALKAEALQLASSGLYSKAWETMSLAVEADPDVGDTQVQLAMEWLRNVRISPGQKEQSFSEIVGKLLPVLHRAIDTTKREYSATVRAHIGWAGFLMFKEGNHTVNADNQFRTALQLDSTNLYAHAMYGFWMIYPGRRGGSLADANRHFRIALQKGENPGYVRHLMFAAYTNASSPESQAQIIRLADEIRKNHETMDFSERERIVTTAYFLYRREIMDEVGKVLPAKDHLETFLYLTEGIDLDAKPYLKDALLKLRTASGEQQ